MKRSSSQYAPPAKLPLIEITSSYNTAENQDAFSPKILRRSKASTVSSSDKFSQNSSPSQKQGGHPRTNSLTFTIPLKGGKISPPRSKKKARAFTVPLNDTPPNGKHLAKKKPLAFTVPLNETPPNAAGEHLTKSQKMSSCKENTFSLMADVSQTSDVFVSPSNSTFQMILSEAHHAKMNVEVDERRCTYILNAAPISKAEDENFDDSLEDASPKTFKVRNVTYNASSETPLSEYINMKLNEEAYVERSPLTSITYVKDDISFGTVHSLSPHEVRFSSTPIETIQRHLSDIEEEPDSRRSVKRRSETTFAVPPTKRLNLPPSGNQWSKKSRATAPYRLSKKSSELNFKQKCQIKKEPVICTTTTTTVIVQDPFLLAATNLLDPFMTPQISINETWVDQQQMNFKKWLNTLLTPPEEFTSEEQNVNVAKVWQDCKSREVPVAATKEAISNNYSSYKMNKVRKAATSLYLSEEMSAVLSKVHGAVDSGKISVRVDKDIHLDILLKPAIINLLSKYNPLWLRIGLETIFRSVIPLRSNSDVNGLNTFIEDNLLKSSSLLKRYKSVHNKTYKAELKKYFLKHFLTLVYFLDQAKARRIIPHDPCLFSKQEGAKEPVKESKEVLFRLTKEVIASIGDITKFLKYHGYVVTHQQTYINEYDYAVVDLGVDLRDGVRLTKVMEIILMRNDLIEKMRVPAISRLQKIHNVQIALDALKQAGYEILYEITAKDIAEGHKEKTLSLLWQIIYKFEAPLMVKSSTTIQRWFRSLPIVIKRKKLARNRQLKENAAMKIQHWYRRLLLSRKLTVFIQMGKRYIEHAKQEKAATTIQSYYRMYKCKSLFQKQREIIVPLQARCRGWLIRNTSRGQVGKVIIAQSYVRMYLERKRYLATKSAVITIQRWYRALMLTKHTRQQYNTLRSTTILIQRKYRANKLTQKHRELFVLYKTAVIIIQRRYRANLERSKARKEYLELRSTCIFVQQKWRAMKLRKICRERYLELRKVAVMIQATWRCKVERRKYMEMRNAIVAIQRKFRAKQKLISACVCVQRRYRANQLMKAERTKYLSLRNAVMTIQSRYRANTQCRLTRDRFLKLKHSSILVQQRWRAMKLGKIYRERYLGFRKATLTVQATWRCKVERRKYMELRNAVVAIQRKFRARQRLISACICVQRRYRAYKLMKIERMNYLSLRNAVITIQNRYRAKIQCRVTRDRFLKLKHTSILVQQKWRAMKLGKTCRERHLELRKVVLTVQATWRCKLERRKYMELRNAVIAIQRKFRAKQRLISACICVQRRYKANKLMRIERMNYLSLRNAVITIQNKYTATLSMRRERKRYLEMVKAAQMIQQYYRRYLERKKQKQVMHSIQGIQRFGRGLLTRRRLEKEKEQLAEKKKMIMAAVRIQATWRGFQSRRCMNKRHLDGIKGLQKAKKPAMEEKTLGERASKSIDILIDSSSHTWKAILTALADIDFVTRISRGYCTSFSELLPARLFLLMGVISRSLPETNACILCSNILINFFKCEESRQRSFVPDHLEKTLKVMLHFCDKDCTVFPSLCTLLWLYAHERKWKNRIRKVNELDQLLSRINESLTRKVNMVKKSGTVKKDSVFVCTREQRKLPNLNADWGYELKKKPYKFTNSEFAFKCLLEILEINF